jgi:adenylate kinase family enzyme
MRIVILGCAGSGKTTLAERLGSLTNVPVISLDIIWQPEWNAENVPAFRDLVRQAHAGDNWVSDGNFAHSTFDIRLTRATQIIWLERSRPFCLWHAASRVFKGGQHHRLERLAEVLKFIWNFDRVNRPRIQKFRQVFGPDVPLQVLKSDREVQDFLSKYATDCAMEGS